MKINAEGLFELVQGGKTEEVATMLKKHEHLVDATTTNPPRLVTGQSHKGEKPCDTPLNALVVACAVAIQLGDLSMLKALTAFKPDLSLPASPSGQTVFIFAVQRKFLASFRPLIDAGANINQALASDGTTPLHHAVLTGDTKVIDRLVALGAKVDGSAATSSRCGTPVHTAAKGVFTGVDADNSASNLKKMLGWTLFRIPSVSTDPAKKKQLLPLVNIADVTGATPLSIAVAAQQTELVSMLLEYGADPSLKEGLLKPAVTTGNLTLVKQLLSFGATPDAAIVEVATAGVADAGDDVEKKKNFTAILTELKKPQPDQEKREANAARFKTQGNKVFGEGEYVKAEKFYTVAISFQPNVHAFFSNRSACRFNLKDNILDGFFDACRCLQLNPTFVRGYYRKASCLAALQEYTSANNTITEGLKHDAANTELLRLKEEVKVELDKAAYEKQMKTLKTFTIQTITGSVVGLHKMSKGEPEADNYYETLMVLSCRYLNWAWLSLLGKKDRYIMDTFTNVGHRSPACVMWGVHELCEAVTPRTPIKLDLAQPMSPAYVTALRKAVAEKMEVELSKQFSLGKPVILKKESTSSDDKTVDELRAAWVEQGSPEVDFFDFKGQAGQ